MTKDPTGEARANQLPPPSYQPGEVLPGSQDVQRRGFGLPGASPPNVPTLGALHSGISSASVVGGPKSGVVIISTASTPPRGGGVVATIYFAGGLPASLKAVRVRSKSAADAPRFSIARQDEHTLEVVANDDLQPNAEYSVTYSA